MRRGCLFFSVPVLAALREKEAGNLVPVRPMCAAEPLRDLHTGGLADFQRVLDPGSTLPGVRHRSSESPADLTGSPFRHQKASGEGRRSEPPESDLEATKQSELTRNP